MGNRRKGTNKHPTKIDILVLCGIPIIGFVCSIGFSFTFLASCLFFYGLPSLYLILRYRNYFFAFKDVVFALIVATPFAIIVDYIGTFSGVWMVPNSVFAFRFLGIIPYEDFIWMFLGTILAVVYYQTFFDRGEHKLVDAKITRFMIPAAVILGIFFGFVATRSEYLLWPGRYTYLILGGVFFLLPSLIFVVSFPRLLKKLIGTIGYFFLSTLLFELSATFLHHWVFAGTYIMRPFSLFGFGFIPFEELFFVGLIGPIAAVAFYEYFDDDLN